MVGILDLTILLILGGASLGIGSYALYLMKEMKRYLFLKVNLILHLIFGAIFWVYELIYLISYELFSKLTYLTMILSLLMMADILYFTRGNMLESIKKFRTSSWIFIIPAVALLADSGTRESAVGFGILIAAFFAGIIIGLILELLYSSYHAYSLTRGGKLYVFWKWILVLALFYIAVGISFSVIGVIVMLGIIDNARGAEIIFIFHLAKSITFFEIAKYYNLNLKNLIERVEML